MSIGQTARARSFVCFAAIALAAVLAGCGGGGGAGEPATVQAGPPPPLPATAQADPPPPALALMADSLGRQVPEADFGGSDPEAAGADGTAFDLGPLAYAAVTLTDAAGTVRTATSDESGYYRMNIKGLTPPFIANVRRGDGTQWFSASSAPVRRRGFITMNLSGLTDKTLGYVADAANIATGAASAVTTALLVANPGALAAASDRIRVALRAQLIKAGLDSASYNPVTTPLATTGSGTHALLLQSLRMIRSAIGRTTVVWTAAGGDSASFSFPGAVAVDAAGNVLVVDGNNVVRAVSPAGVVKTLAGTGQHGRADGTRATATFEGLHSIVVLPHLKSQFAT